MSGKSGGSSGRMSESESDECTNLLLRFGEDFVINMLVDFRQKTFSEIKINGEEFSCLNCLAKEASKKEDLEKLVYRVYEDHPESIIPDDTDTSQTDEPEEDWINIRLTEDVDGIHEIVLEPPEAFSDTKRSLTPPKPEAVTEPVRITRIRKVKKKPGDPVDFLLNDIETPLKSHRDMSEDSKTTSNARIEPPDQPGSALVVISKKKNCCRFAGCTYRSKNLSDVVKHEYTHTRTSLYDCEDCNKSFTQKCSLQRHISSVHLQHKKIRCNICNTAFRDNYTLKRHKIHSHPGE